MNSKSKVIIVFFLLIIVGALCYYIYANKDKNYVNPPAVVDTIKKEFKDKEYVFNTSYSTEQIAFPYINLDYTTISDINFQIKKLYETNLENISNASYDFYINDTILSVVIKVNIEGVDNYFTYNIDMENGKELLYEDVFYKYSKSDLVLKDKINEYIDSNEAIKSHIDGIALTKEYVTDTSYNNYKINALSNNVSFYLDKENKINVIVKIELNEVYYDYAVFEL